MLQVRWSLQSNNPNQRKRMASPYKPDKAQKVGRPISINLNTSSQLLAQAGGAAPVLGDDATRMGLALFDTLSSSFLARDPRLPTTSPSDPNSTRSLASSGDATMQQGHARQSLLSGSSSMYDRMSKPTTPCLKRITTLSSWLL